MGNDLIDDAVDAVTFPTWMATHVIDRQRAMMRHLTRVLTDHGFRVAHADVGDTVGGPHHRAPVFDRVRDAASDAPHGANVTVLAPDEAGGVCVMYARAGMRDGYDTPTWIAREIADVVGDYGYRTMWTRDTAGVHVADPITFGGDTRRADM